MNNKYYIHTRSELLPYVPVTTASALDVGCASGVFGKSLKEKFGAVVWGIEPNEEAALLAKAQLDFVMHSGFDESVKPVLGEQRFDAIFFNDVLEHLVNPDDALRLAKNYLSDRGCVIASIPNILHFDAIYPILKNRDWKYEAAGVMDKTHLRFFTKKSMIRLFQETGFEVEVIEGINAYYGRFVHYLNRFTFNHFDELKYPQFVIRARKA